MPHKSNFQKTSPEYRRRLDRLMNGLQHGSCSGLPRHPEAEGADPAGLGAPKEWQAIVRYLWTAPRTGLPGWSAWGLDIASATAVAGIIDRAGIRKECSLTLREP